MPIRTPLTYIRHRRDQAHVRKPTTHSKVASYCYINPQAASPLFSELPGEIRRLIYQYALTGSPDESRPFSKHSWHYRPGYTHARFINTNLLLACRRIYLEADHLAIAVNEHLIFQPAGHGPPNHSPYLLTPISFRTSSSTISKRRGLLKDAQREHIQQVHIFAQQHWLEDWNNQWYDYCTGWSAGKLGIGPNGNEHPPRLKITIRHTDWWYFLLGENSPLALDPKHEGRAPPQSWIPNEAPFRPNCWGSRFVSLKGLKVFELELETLKQKKHELDEVIEQAVGWEFPLSNDEFLVCDRDATQYAYWTGSKHFDGAGSISKTLLNQGRGMSSSSSTSATTSSPTASRSHSIVTITKKTQRVNQILPRAPGMQQEVGKEELKPEDRLDYYIVTLIYRAQKHEERVNDKGENEDGSQEDGTDATAAAAGLPAPTPANLVAPHGLPTTANPPTGYQGVYTPAPWVPRRTGFPTAYG